MRKFYIRNSKGEQKPLNNENKIFFQGPTGMGFTINNSYSELADGFFTNVKRSQDTNNVMGSLYFTGDTLDSIYQLYQDFVSWVLSDSNLVLVYSPYSGQNYYADVDIAYINKNDIDRTGALICPCSFYCKTPWYKPYELKVPMGVESDNAMMYDFDYTDELVYATSASEAHTVEVIPEGQLDQGFILEYNDEILNPIITVIGQDTGNVYSQVKIYENFLIGDKFIYSVKPNDSYAIKVHNGEIYDLINTIDPTSTPFILIPLAEPVIIRLSGSNDFSGEASVKVFSYYRSV